MTDTKEIFLMFLKKILYVKNEMFGYAKYTFEINLYPQRT